MTAVAGLEITTGTGRHRQFTADFKARFVEETSLVRSFRTLRAAMGSGRSKY
jgi:hypothetical protein